MGRYSLREQSIRGLRIGGLIAIVTGVILGVVYLVTRAADIPFSTLTRDAAATLDGPWYTAALSNSSIVLLFMGAGIALFTAGVLPRSSGRSPKGSLTALAIFMVLVAADDLFMLHEAVYPEFGFSSVITFATYGVVAVAILWIWREVIFQSTDYVFLVLAGLGMAITVAVDVILEERLLDLPFSGELIEDPAKILGYVFMAYYLISSSRRALLQNQDVDPA
jgi:hypothetical protein